MFLSHFREFLQRAAFWEGSDHINVLPFYFAKMANWTDGIKGRRSGKSSVFWKYFQKIVPFKMKLGLPLLWEYHDRNTFTFWKETCERPVDWKKSALLPLCKESKQTDFLRKVKSSFWLDSHLHLFIYFSPPKLLFYFIFYLFLQLFVLEWKSDWILESFLLLLLLLWRIDFF